MQQKHVNPVDFCDFSRNSIVVVGEKETSDGPWRQFLTSLRGGQAIPPPCCCSKFSDEMTYKVLHKNTNMNKNWEKENKCIPSS